MKGLVCPLTVTLLLLAAVACSRGKEERQGGAPPAVPVVVATSVEKTVPVQLRAIGNVQPSNTVTVRARVGGILEKVHFAEGDDVRDGQALFTIERAPLEAELRQAEGAMARDNAQLETARRDAERYTELARQGYVAQQQADQTRAAARALEATVRADRAAVENARIRLGYATIRAPIAGRTGSLMVHEGDVIKVNDTAMVVINQLRPIDIAFTLPERELDAVRRRGEGLPVAAVAAQSGEALAQGKLSFIDNRVDQATGTIQLKATFANTEARLWPGAYANVVMTLGNETGVVVPSQAVQRGQEGTYLFVVKPDRTVESRPVSVARAVGEESVIAQGLAAGETVVTEGQLRLAPGARVEPRTVAAATAGTPPVAGTPAADAAAGTAPPASGTPR
jgi:membrane fusion protein, multidrug efflux system